MSFPTNPEIELVSWTLDIPANEESFDVLPNITEIEPVDDGCGPEETTFGFDARQPITNLCDISDGGKFRSIVKIFPKFLSNGQLKTKMGTGWLFKDNLVVTAGHVVTDIINNYAQAREIACYIGYKGRLSLRDGNSDAQVRYGRLVATPKEWNETHPPHRDIAFIEVGKPFTGNLRLFKWKDTPRREIFVDIHIVGYPGDILGESPDDLEYGAQMVEHNERTDYEITKTSKMIRYKVHTSHGQSGSPILQKERGQFIAIGTHCYGSSVGKQVNSGNSIGGEYGNNYLQMASFIKANRLNVWLDKKDKTIEGHLKTCTLTFDSKAIWGPETCHDNTWKLKNAIHEAYPRFDLIIADKSKTIEGHICSISVKSDGKVILDKLSTHDNMVGLVAAINSILAVVL